MDPMDKYLVIAKYLSIGPSDHWIHRMDPIDSMDPMDKYLVIAKYLSIGSIRSIGSIGSIFFFIQVNTYVFTCIKKRWIRCIKKKMDPMDPMDLMDPMDKYLAITKYLSIGPSDPSFFYKY